MFEFYTESAKGLIVRAKREASRLGSREIDPEHILLALLQDEIIVNGAFLFLNTQELRSEILSLLPQGEPLLLSTDLPLSSESKMTLKLASEEANVRNGGEVETWHMLLGLLRVEASPVFTFLKGKGLSIETIRNRLPTARGKSFRRPSRVQAIAAEAEFPEIIKRAIGLAGSGKHKEALALLDDVLSKTTEDAQVRALLHIAVIISRSMGDLDLTRSYCERRLALDPEDAPALYNLADCLALQGRPELAKEYAAKSYELSMASVGSLRRTLCELIERRFPELKRER